MHTTQAATTELGSTELEITRVGFGAWAIGGGGWESGWGPQDGAVAIAWTLRNPAVDGAIVGLRRPDQVDELLVGATPELSDEDAVELERRRG